MFGHDDTLSVIDEDVPLQRKLLHVHNVLKDYCPYVDRVAVALYDPRTDMLKTFVHSSDGDEPLVQHQAKLADCQSLLETKEARKPRLLGDLQIFSGGQQKHTRKIKEQGYQSSYTLPVFANGAFFGFVFFNSYQPKAFSDVDARHLDVFGHLVSLAVMNELHAVQSILSTVRTARSATGERDAETGSHLDRMSRYSRMIAQSLADQYGFTDEHIENIFLFSPLHDIGKLGIPDRLLRKPGRLDAQEREEMQTHVTKGRNFVDRLLLEFDSFRFPHLDMLRNIVSCHHETMNGTGYPNQLAGEAIPIEARIVAVADIFDALTSKRPYKEAWTNEQAFTELSRLAGPILDPDCVTALLAQAKQIEEIQEMFPENSVG